MLVQHCQRIYRRLAQWTEYFVVMWMGKKKKKKEK